jgi:pimeloyl-ACP methyl ester carboxylesterase
MGLASPPRFRSCAYLLSPGLQPTFTPWQRGWPPTPAKPRLVLAIDYRGHGQSEYDRNPDNYTLPVALADLSAILTALEIAPLTLNPIARRLDSERFRSTPRTCGRFRGILSLR